VGREILVDGYNIIRRNPTFKVAGPTALAAARERLIGQLVSRYRHTPHQVTVVFDGAGNVEQVSTDRRVRIIYSRQGETADSVIARLAKETRAAGREVEMYSDDGEVRDAVSAQGGEARSSEQLATQLNAAPRDVARRFRNRQAVLRRYAADNPDTAPEPPHQKGDKKRRRH
jgi:predicted RNA-binding protein with PIN domain